MQQLQLKPVQIDTVEFQHYQQMYQLHQLNQYNCNNYNQYSYQRDGIVYQSESNGYNTSYGCYYPNQYYCQYPMQFNQITFEQYSSNALTFQNLQNSGLAYMTDEQKDKRVAEWLQSDQSDCLYPIDL